MVVYDVTDKRTFDDMKNYWVPEIMDHCNEPVELFLVANKIDKMNEREISKESARQSIMNDPNLRARDEISAEDELMKEKSRHDIYK